jgi:hypothetical protein
MTPMTYKSNPSDPMNNAFKVVAYGDSMDWKE